ncbi:hypothetical protein L6452_01151 [Arctium lappa]|uniref:Uncharacterized protein n=1 Tax=Arctium lappa TaxID=4217 RepID=A0ACB9FGA6_ARCLA|nr:hypothetical protein L6452_01151 [Arctium lappa]
MDPPPLHHPLSRSPYGGINGGGSPSDSGVDSKEIAPVVLEEGTVVGGRYGDGSPADGHGYSQETATIVADEGMGGRDGGISPDDGVVDGDGHDAAGLSFDLNVEIKMGWWPVKMVATEPDRKRMRYGGGDDGAPPEQNYN